MERGYLVLKRASASRPSGEWSHDDYDVLADGVVVGRIFKANAAPVGTPWLWRGPHGPEPSHHRRTLGLGMQVVLCRRSNGGGVAADFLQQGHPYFIRPVGLFG